MNTTKTNGRRAGGILLHITSLPGTPGIGTMGVEAYHFVDWLKKAGEHLWQVLPLGPTGYGDSPYASFSTFAGNPLLIDLDDLVNRGWASGVAILPPEYIQTTGNIDYGSVVWWKTPVLKKCAEYFLEHCSSQDRASFEAFKNDESAWLDNFATFMSIKEHYDEKAASEKVTGVASVWNAYWPKELASADPKSVSEWQEYHAKEIEVFRVIQFFFAVQWSSLKKYANDNGVQIIGDIPIFVALDSADVWSHQNLFQMDKNSGQQLRCAGVPPDYFSATGQLWGNPLYNWDEMKATNYFWWIDRIKRMLSLVDFVRIDHFRGFEAYWSIPYGEPTAVNGKWVAGPNKELFDAIKNALGDIPIIAEDLGVITDGVKALRDGCGFPGMKVLQFAFDANEANDTSFTNAFLPHLYTQNCVVYTGTHDNDTMQGWLNNSPDGQLVNAASYILGRKCNVDEAKMLRSSGELCAKMIQAAVASTANFAVVPLQDVYTLGSEARMNTPSTTGANWCWRMDASLLEDGKASWLKYMNMLYARV